MSHRWTIPTIGGRFRPFGAATSDVRRPVRARLVEVLVVGVALLVASGMLGALSPSPAVSAAAAGRTWVVDAVDSARDNQWVSADTGTSRVTIAVGDTVEWQFDQATMSHDLTSLDSSSDWDPPVQQYRDPGGTPIRHTFTEPGTYEYWCTLHGATMRGTVVVQAAPNQPPTAVPLVDPRTGPAPLYTHFDAHATDPDGDALTYLWDFGESDAPADTSTSSHAHHSYTTPGRYTATLRVSDGRGGTYENSWTITVTGGVKPIVTVGANPTSGTAPLTVVLMGSAQDEQGGNLTYAWDFGVAGTDADTSQNARATYTYTRPGTYRAVLAVTDPEGNTGTGSVTIVVAGGPSEPTIGVTATAAPVSGTSPLEVQLGTQVTEASTTAGEVTAFADGLVSYPGLSGSAGLVRGDGHTMTSLRVSGLKPSAAHMVHVHEEPCSSRNGGAHFRFDETEPYAEANEIWLPFTSDASGASPDLVEHSALRAGPKAVSLVVHDPDNPAKRIGCADLVPTGLTYAWDFGDGTTGAGAAPRHTYTRPGTFTATVTVTDGATGDQATGSVELVVRDGAVVPGGPPAGPVPPSAPDRLAPDTLLVAGPTGATRSRTATFRLGASETGSTFACSLDGAAYQPCAATPTFSDLRDGTHRLEARATDPAGNTDASPVVSTWQVDTHAPTIRAAGPSGTTRDRTPTLRATVRDRHTRAAVQRLVLRIDGRTVRGVRYDPRTQRMTWTSAQPMPVGRHRVRLVAVDTAGNRTTERWRFTLEP